MILVCDTDVSERAAWVRDALRGIGYPTAVSRIDDIKNHLPFCLIITFADVFSEVRRTPFDDTFVIAIGDGFVNTALNAVQAKDIISAETFASDFIRKICEEIFDRHSDGGLFVPPFYFSGEFFEIYSNLVAPTKSEYMILKFLVFCSHCHAFADTNKIREYCFLGNQAESNVISAHISSLNSKISNAYGKKIVRSKRFCGYYLEIT